MARIELPTSPVASAGIGGAGRYDLYITTAGDETTPGEDPWAGGLFRLTVDIPGRPEFPSRVRP